MSWCSGRGNPCGPEGGVGWGAGTARTLARARLAGLPVLLGQLGVLVRGLPGAVVVHAHPRQAGRRRGCLGLLPATVTVRAGRGHPGVPSTVPVCRGGASLTSSPGLANPGCWQADLAAGTQPGQWSKGMVTLQRVPQHPAGTGMSPRTSRCPGTRSWAGTYLLVVRGARGLIPCQQHVLQRDQLIVLAVCGGQPPPRRAHWVPPRAPARLLWRRPGCGVLPAVGLPAQGPHSRLRQHRDMAGTVRCHLARWGAPAGHVPPVGMGLSGARRLPPSAHPFPGARGFLGSPGGCGDSTGVSTDSPGAQGGLWGQRRGD